MRTTGHGEPFPGPQIEIGPEIGDDMATTLGAQGQASADSPRGGGAWADDRKVRLGMLFYVLTDITFGFFMLATYVWLRAYNTDGNWRPTQIGPDMSQVELLTLIIVVSALSFGLATLGARLGNGALLKGGLLVALLLVVVNLIGSVYAMGHFNFTSQDGGFASTYLVLTAYHIYHLLIGLFLGVGLSVRALRGRYVDGGHLGVTVAGYYWYWMTLLAVAVWLLLVLLPPQI